MNSTQRTILAAVLIFISFLAIPWYFEWIGVTGVDDDATTKTSEGVNTKIMNPPSNSITTLRDDSLPNNKQTNGDFVENEIKIITSYYNITLSTYGGGTILEYSLIKKDGAGDFLYSGSSNWQISIIPVSNPAKHVCSDRYATSRESAFGVIWT